MKRGTRGGRKPKPTELKLLDGSRQPINENEPKPDPANPDMPAWFTAREREIWEDLVPKLEDLNLLTNLDTDTLVRYCSAEAQFEKAQKALNKEGEVVQTPFGPKKSPWVIIGRDASRLANSLAAEFGLSPAMRTRIAVKPRERPANPKAERAKRMFGK